MAPATTVSVPDDRFCEDARNDGAGNFDLLDASVQRFKGGYRFGAGYLGPSSGRVVLVAFNLDGYAYQVRGKLFQDGTSVASVVDFKTNFQTNFDDGIVTDGYVNVLVPDDLMASVVGTDFSFEVILNVDGADIDTCR